MGGIEQPRLGQMGDRTATPISGEHGISKRRLMQPRLDLAKGIAALWSGWEGSLCRSPYERPEGKLNP